MSRGRKPAISPYERRRWLEDLEGGKGITEIARAASHDIRTVKRHIEVSRDERQLTQVTHDFLLGRLQQHQKDLLDEVQRLRRAVARRPPRPVEPNEPHELKIHEALKEHVKRLRLRSVLESYIHAVMEYEKARDGVNKKLSEAEAGLVSRLQEKLRYSWTPSVVETLEHGAPLRGSSARPYLENKESSGTYRPSWGEYSLTSFPVSEAGMRTIFEAHRKLLALAEAYVPIFEDHLKMLRERATQLIDELDVLALRRLVPGRCRYCPV